MISVTVVTKNEYVWVVIGSSKKYDCNNFKLTSSIVNKNYLSLPYQPQAKIKTTEKKPMWAIQL